MSGAIVKLDIQRGAAGRVLEDDLKEIKEFGIDLFPLKDVLDEDTVTKIKDAISEYRKNKITDFETLL